MEQLEADISLPEYLRWQEFYRTEPFVPERVDLAGALVSSIIANANRSKGGRARTVDEFMIVANSLRHNQRARDESIHLKTFIISMGGRVS